MSSAPFAFVSLVTSDSYLPGALALAAALKEVHSNQDKSEQNPPHEIVCLATPETLDVSTMKLLRKTFDVVIGVEVITQNDEKGLTLLGRLDLTTVLTKIHAFRLTQYSKVIFLDADILPIRPLSHLFKLPHEFSAVPDVGWPDIFNSGMMVLSPGEHHFNNLQELLRTRGSWDGGDQGLLNEWRGGDWNRLSFTYNTTPTAAYTYAPAYERFGSNISAIHFIGPNKPWYSIAYRAPGSSASTRLDRFQTNPEATTNSQPAYDYNSLVDRWYAVYDRNYRSQELHTIAPEVDFDVRRYASAWNEHSNLDAAPVDATVVPSGRALGLDDLRRIAVQGMSSWSFLQADRANREGEYRSMPLEGRIDLMRPNTDNVEAALHIHSQVSETASESTTKPKYDPEPLTPVTNKANLPTESPVRWATLSTPGPNDLPPTPHARVLSLPPTPLHYIPQQYPHRPITPPPDLPNKTAEQTLRKNERPRPSSPPLIAWNPAIEEPPKTTPPRVFNTDTYFTNVWYQSPTKASDHPPHSLMSASSSSRSMSSSTSTTLTSPPSQNALFQPPPQPEIPESLVRQGHYRNVTGPSSDEATVSPSPDHTKVKRVFPWEERPRQMPGRVFPENDAPSPAMFLRSAPVPTMPETPEKKVRPGMTLPAMPSPLVGFPPALNYANAWDGVPSIQKYASKLARPEKLAALEPAFEERRGRRSSRAKEDKTDASSEDGDVEDEVDSSDDESWTSRGSRNLSSGKARKATYHSTGVQTLGKSVRHMSTQVDELPVLSVTAQDGVAVNEQNMASTTGAARPQGLSSSLQSSGTPTPIVTTPKANKNAYMEIPPLSDGQASNEGSPLSSIGPVSPLESSPTKAGHGRKLSGRVWDPARGVELFKKSSEEVLARFMNLKM